MKLAIGEDLLPGAGVHEGLDLARELGFGGVEFIADRLDERIDAIDEGLRALDLVACGVAMGECDGWVSADIGRRREANDRLREALAGALDLGAEYVSFAPQRGASDMPDLTPFASPLELQKELLIWLLRGYSDLAEAMDAGLALLPLNRGESAFLTRLDQGAALLRAVDDHPMIRLAANTCDMALEEADLLASVESHIADIGVFYLADSGDSLPGQGTLPFPEIGASLRRLEYAGWLVIAGRPAGREGDRPDDLRACLDYLRDCGIE